MSNNYKMSFDILKEIGNIGAGNAATAMAKLLNQKFDMDVPSVELLDFKDVPEAIHGAENIIAGILVALSGDVSGIMMFLLEENSGCRLLNDLMGRSLTSFSSFTDMDLSAISEIGNIMAGSYLGALSTLTNLKITPSIPYVSIDMAGAILSVPAIEFGKIGDQVLFIKSSFMGVQEEIAGYFLLVPDLESFHVILKSLGMYTE